jgi:hypothetical protein
MMNVVEIQHGGGPEAGGQQRPEDTSGDITWNFSSSNFLGDNRKRGRYQHGLNVWARGLCKEEFQKIYRLRIVTGVGEVLCRGGSCGKLISGIEWTGTPATGTLMTAGGLERASATTFSEPGVCLRSEVNSEMYARWRCWRADCGGEMRVMAATSGL